LVTRALVENNDSARLRKGFAKAIDPEVEGEAVAVWQLQKEAVSSGRVHCSIELEVVELLRDGEHGLHATGGNPATTDRP
jgi:hypothetical protein